MTEERAKKIYDQEMKVEQDYSEYITGMLILVNLKLSFNEF